MENVPLNAIDIHDRTFAISYPLADSRLMESIGTIGIIQPVLLRKGPPCLIICGFRRVLAAVRQGLTDIPAILLPVSEKEGLLLALHDNLSRGLNAVEKAHAVERMVRFGFTEPEINDAARLMGISAHPSRIRTFLGLAGSDDRLKAFVTERDSSMKNIEYLLGFEAAERIAILDLLTPFIATESLTREVLEMLTLLKIRQVPVDYEKLAASSDLKALKASLKRRIAPVLSELEEQLRVIAGRAKLPPGLTIKVDPFFEKEYIDILIRARREEDVESALEKVLALLRDGIIRSLFGLTAGQVR